MVKDALRHTSQTSWITCLAPCVCLTPVGGAMVPVPYMIFSKLAWSERTMKNAHFRGKEAFTMDSRTNKVTGNEQGKGGGIVSGVNIGWCRPQSNKSSFFINGQQVIQDDCVFEMNCAGADGISNTVGKSSYSDR